jgi:predicted nucleotidyltransferase component of viral defense system
LPPQAQGVGVIEMIQQRFREDMSTNDKINVAREFLQILCLKIMSEKKVFEHIAFVGGTSLRILFGLRRFSEDLDFSLQKEMDFSIARLNEQLQKSFSLYGLEIETKIKSEGSIQNIMLKFPGLLKELELSDLPRQKLSIKVEIDINPPRGWQTVHSMVHAVYMFSVIHYDLSSLFAGKLHACFYRTFTKGRDLYDFIWYLGKNIKPNFILLNNAIRQTEGTNPGINEENFNIFLLENVRKIDMARAKKDVERFLEDKSELHLFDQKLIVDTIKSAY